jgi:hypothetical protein
MVTEYSEAVTREAKEVQGKCRVVRIRAVFYTPNEIVEEITDDGDDHQPHGNWRQLRRLQHLCSCWRVWVVSAIVDRARCGRE